MVPGPVGPGLAATPAEPGIGSRPVPQPGGETLMDPSVSDRDPVEELAEEFVERYRRGERPSLEEYADRFPEWADRIRALFPALVVMEKVRPGPDDGTGPGAEAGAAGARPERLGDFRIIREIGHGGMG